MGDSKGIFLFYHLQGERGESSAHPNACKVYPAVAGKVTLAEVLAAFPLYGTASFHFRFQVAADKQIMFLDLTNPNDVVPMVNGSIIAKVLRLDNAKAITHNAYGLRLRMVPSRNEPVDERIGSPASSLHPPVGGSGAIPCTAAPVPAPTPTTAPARSSAGGSGGVSSPVVAAAMPAYKPVKAVPDVGPVVVPDVVDADLADKSDYVKAEVMKRRAKLAEEQSRRITEASDRDDALKQEQDNRDMARTMFGPKLKEWAEEASGSRKNIRLLLSTLQVALWPEAKWEPVPMAKLIEPKRVKMTFLRACTLVHPDKQNTMDGMHKFIATQIFHYLETAFRLFQETEMGGAS